MVVGVSSVLNVPNLKSLVLIKIMTKVKKKEIKKFNEDTGLAETIDIIKYYNQKWGLDLDKRALREILRNQIRIIKLLNNKDN